MINNEWGFITLPTHADPEQRAIARLKIASEMSLEHYKTPLLLTHSGGKDSCVLTELALRTGYRLRSCMRIPRPMHRKPPILCGVSLCGWRIAADGAESTTPYINVGVQVCGT